MLEFDIRASEKKLKFSNILVYLLWPISRNSVISTRDVISSFILDVTSDSSTCKVTYKLEEEKHNDTQC